MVKLAREADFCVTPLAIYGNFYRYGTYGVLVGVGAVVPVKPAPTLGDAALRPKPPVEPPGTPPANVVPEIDPAAPGKAPGGVPSAAGAVPITGVAIVVAIGAVTTPGIPIGAPITGVVKPTGPAAPITGAVVKSVG
jgi:hypothetical protein